MPIGKLAAVLINLAIVGGGMAMQYLLTPKQQGIASDQGKLDDIRITGSEYGTLIPRVWGRARMGSNVVWSSGIRHEIINYQSSGGKGATPATATTTHVYRADIGMEICRGPITGFGKIWADSDIINGEGSSTGQVEAEAATLAGGAAIQTSSNASGGNFVKTLGSVEFGTTLLAPIKTPPKVDEQNQTTAQSYLTIYYKCSAQTKLRVQCWAENGTTSLYDQVITLEDMRNDGNWNPYIIRISRTKAQGAEFVGKVTLSKDGANTAPDIDLIALAKTWLAVVGPTTLVTPSTGIKSPYVPIDDNALDLAPYFNYHPTYTTGKSDADLTVGHFARYLGTSTQEADAKFIEWLDEKYGTGNGVDFAMAYRDVVCVVMYDYNLRGGRIPNYTFEVIESSVDLGDVLPTIFADCGLSAGNYDISEVENITFYGLVETSRQSKKAFLESLGTYFGFRMYESDGKIRFTLDNDFTSVGTIDEDILRARAEGEEAKPYDAELLYSPTAELPREVRFNVMNPLLDYHNDTVVASLFCEIASEDAKEFNFPIVDFPVNARLRAENAILKMYSETKMVTFTAMPEMLKYNLGDVVEVTLNDIDFKVRIEKMEIGLPIGVIKVEAAVIEEFDPAEIFVTVNQTSSTTEAMQSKMVNLRNVKIIPIMSLPIRGRDKGRLGCYVAVSPIGYGAIDNIALYREAGGDNYVLLDILDVPATVGIGSGTLGGHANAAVEDTTNTLDISFYNEVSLESFTAAELLRYPTLNLIRIGDEWVQFRTATLQALPADSKYRSVWRISNLQRGRFGTSAEMSAHSANEDCVIWDDTIKFYDLNPEDDGETVILKATSGGQLVEDAKAFDFTFSQPSLYTITNDTRDRTLDANSTDMDELADVLSTLIRDSNL